MQKKKILAAVAAVLFLLTITGMANATLTTIGTASYNDGTGSADYNLIWDDNNNGNSVVWLDYANSAPNWVTLGNGNRKMTHCGNPNLTHHLVKKSIPILLFTAERIP